METDLTFTEWLTKGLPLSEVPDLFRKERIIKKMWGWFEHSSKPETNPSAIASMLWYVGFKEEKFTDLRKLAEYQYKIYCNERSRLKN